MNTHTQSKHTCAKREDVQGAMIGEDTASGYVTATEEEPIAER